MEAEVLKTQNFFSVLALIFIIVFNAGWVFLIPAGVKKESKPFLFTLLGVYLIIIFLLVIKVFMQDQKAAKTEAQLVYLTQTYAIDRKEDKDHKEDK